MKNNFETFSSIEDTKLRVFNRTALLFNLTEDFGKETAQEYLELFSEGERAQMLVMTKYIEAKGLDAIKKEVTRGLEIVYDASVEEEETSVES